MLLPRTLSAPETPNSDTLSGYVIWSSMSLGERPGHGVSTITWFSPTSGIASIGAVRKQYHPRTTTPMVTNTTKGDSRTQNWMIRLSMTVSAGARRVDRRPCFQKRYDWDPLRRRFPRVASGSRSKSCPQWQPSRPLPRQPG